MKIVALSDNHGILPEIKEPADIAVIAGDLVNLYFQTSYVHSRDWFLIDFKNWAENLPVEHVFFIGGNHDFYLQDISNTKTKLDEFNKSLGDKITYIYNNVCEYTKDGQTIHILGTPICHQFGYWAFMPSDEYARKKFNDIKLPKDKKIDILLSHDAPYGTSDQLLQSTRWQKEVPGPHIGSEPLKEYIEKIQPRYCLHGHLHSTNHELEMLGETKVYNVSIVDEAYENVYEPLYLEI